ncbi:hypothetical protein E4T44_12450 [Aureobasidium sp. EXF-8845]|nr:hypothetical protein E4T44_12450 [Aureobasidium sp. EXF-8845]
MSDALSPATTSPIALERRNSLEKAILNRPEAHELREKHILLNTNAAPFEALPTEPCTLSNRSYNVTSSRIV